MVLGTFVICFVLLRTFASGTEGECPPLLELVNGRFLRVDYRTVLLRCHFGYKLLGPRQIRCYHGNWTPSPLDAYCSKPENECLPPPEVANGDRWVDDHQIPGSQVLYTCRDGFFMLGDNKLVCGSNRHWDKDPPQCFDKLTNLKEIEEILRNQIQIKESNTNFDKRALFLGPEVFEQGLELFFLLDRSSSIDPRDLELAKIFLKKLLDTFGTDNSLKTSRIRLGVISFGNKAEVVCALDDMTVNSTEQAFQRINSIKAEGGGTAMQPALSLVLGYAFREKAKRALFLLTDGEPNVGDVEPEDVARILKSSEIGMEIFTLGIGHDIQHQRLIKMASEPTASHAFFLQGFQDFHTILEGVENPPTTLAPIPPPSPKACGIADVDNNSESKPWLTAILVDSSVPNSPGESRVTFCAGVLLCSQWVLTSGGCLQNRTGKLRANQIFLTVGVKDLTTVESGTTAYALEVHLSPKHQKIQDSRFRLALVKLDRALPSSAGRPICLPQKNLNAPLSQNLQTVATLEGWGTRSWNASLSSSILNPSGTRHLSNSISTSLLEVITCERVIRMRINATVHLREKIICTGEPADHRKDNPLLAAECAGSLGSPLVGKDISTKGHRHYLLGIQTDLHGCREGPVVYVDPLHYLSWIKTFTGDCVKEHLN